MKADPKTAELEELEQQLLQLRQESLQATRNNNYQAIASLTIKTARLNETITQLKGDGLTAEIGRASWNV